MIVIWSLALIGILFKLTIAHRFKILSLVTYLTMGWLSLIVVYQLAVKLAAGGVTLLAVGGVVYSLGVIFYVCKRIPYNHAIWHGFVLGGSVCHFLGDLSVRGATRIDSVQPRERRKRLARTVFYRPDKPTPQSGGLCRIA